MPTQLLLGNSIIQDAVETFDCWRSRKEPVDVLSFTLRQVGVTVADKAQTKFLLALPGGELKAVFSGAIDRVNPPYRARDKMGELMQQPVREAFQNVLPQEVLSYALQKFGVTKVSLTTKRFNRKNFVASVPSFYELINQVNIAWGVEYDGYFDMEETFHWHEQKQQNQLHVFAYGENIINIEFDGIQGTILTIPVPDIQHSQLIGIEHPEVEANEAIVDTVHHFTNSSGGLRTEIFFTAV